MAAASQENVTRPTAFVPESAATARVNHHPRRGSCTRRPSQRARAGVHKGLLRPSGHMLNRSRGGTCRRLVDELPETPAASAPATPRTKRKHPPTLPARKRPVTVSAHCRDRGLRSASPWQDRFPRRDSTSRRRRTLFFWGRVGGNQGGTTPPGGRNTKPEAIATVFFC